MDQTAPSRGQNTGALDFAREHAAREVPYRFSELETRVLDLFFSNTTRYTFVVQNMPSNVLSALLAMYSRLKNPRGIRGILVDSLVPNFLASKANSNVDPQEFFRQWNVRGLEDFVALGERTRKVYETFCEKVAGDPDYMEDFSRGERIQRFLAMWLDKYGHNSIARTGMVVVCCEQISMLAAKTLEHVRSGAGFIELSTRYVDMASADWYPIASEARAAGLSDEGVAEHFQLLSEVYLRGSGEGGYSAFLADLYPGADDGAIFGEVCDVLANVLPAGAYTSVGCAVSGEALQSMLKCLQLEGLPETAALAEQILSELAKSGLSQFARHVEPTEFERATVQYLSVAATYRQMRHGRGLGQHGNLLGWTRSEVENGILEAMKLQDGCQELESIEEWAGKVGASSRGTHDKLPPFFEEGLARFGYVTTFRTWRELSRHVLCSHGRTLLTPDLGFFEHSKPISTALEEDFQRVVDRSNEMYYRARGKSLWNHRSLQYLLPMGFKVGATLSANVRQLEFLTWQRSGWNVNHECRRVVLGFDAELSEKLPWWPLVSRTDRTPAYRFAREQSGVPCDLTQRSS